MDRKSEWNYLFAIIKYSLSGGECPKIKGTLDWDYLYKLCGFHKIEAVVCNGIERLPQAQRPQKILEKLQEHRNLEMARDATQYFELEELLDAFESEGVDCLPLKGILMKQFYPSPELRMMADLDILYRPEQEAEVDRILLAKGYTFDHKASNHAVYFKLPFMNIEMHYRLGSEDEKFNSYYEGAWNRAKLQEGKRSIYHFSWEDYYVFMLVHMVKHFQNGGSGIRSIIDIWQFTKKMGETLDWDYIETEFGKMHIGAFHRHIRRLVNIWFQDEPSSEFYDTLTEFLVNSGVYGTVRNSRILQVLTMNHSRKTVRYGQLRVWILIIFLPREQMMQQYTYLERHPALLPVAWLHRIFRTLFKRGTATRVLGDATVDQSNAVDLQSFFEELQL